MAPSGGFWAPQEAGWIGGNACDAEHVRWVVQGLRKGDADGLRSRGSPSSERSAARRRACGCGFGGRNASGGPAGAPLQGGAPAHSGRRSGTAVIRIRVAVVNRVVEVHVL